MIWCKFIVTQIPYNSNLKGNDFVSWQLISRKDLTCIPIASQTTT